MNKHTAEIGARWKSCYTCRDYATERREVIAQPLADKARLEGRDVIAVVDEFMDAAHVRHAVSGQPLREGGPTRITDPAIHTCEPGGGRRCPGCLAAAETACPSRGRHQ